MGNDDSGKMQRELRAMNNGDKRYRIALVGEGDLPPDKDFAFLEWDGQVWLAMKRTRLSEPLLEDAWTTYRATA